jgi:hypothetical protein
MNLKTDVKVLSSQEVGLILQMKIKYPKIMLSWDGISSSHAERHSPM